MFTELLCPVDKLLKVFVVREPFSCHHPPQIRLKNSNNIQVQEAKTFNYGSTVLSLKVLRFEQVFRIKRQNMVMAQTSLVFVLKAFCV